MPFFRKKPVVIEAIQYTGDNLAAAKAFLGDEGKRSWAVGAYFFIDTREGRLNVSVGDWIIKGVAGEHYPCKPEIFEATYEAAA